MPPATAFPQARGGLSPQVLRRVEDYIEAHIDGNLDLEQLAQAASMSLYHFARGFKASAGVPPHQYVLQRRINLACDLLARTDLPIADVAIATGFSDQSHLTRHFRQSLGVPPGAYRRARR